MTAKEAAVVQQELREMRDAAEAIANRLSRLHAQLYEKDAHGGDLWLATAAHAIDEAHDNLGTAAIVDYSRR